MIESNELLRSGACRLSAGPKTRYEGLDPWVTND